SADRRPDAVSGLVQRCGHHGLGPVVAASGNATTTLGGESVFKDSSEQAKRIPQRAADPWERLAEANLTQDARAARRAFAQIRTQLRARWLLPFDAILLALDAERELSAATAAQLAEYAQDGAR